MSHKHYAPQVRGVMHDIQVMSYDEIQDYYGIEIDNDGSIWDPLEGKSFKDIHEWATFAAEQEEDVKYDNFTKIGGKRYYDDD